MRAKCDRDRARSRHPPQASAHTRCTSFSTLPTDTAASHTHCEERRAVDRLKPAPSFIPSLFLSPLSSFKRRILPVRQRSRSHTHIHTHTPSLYLQLWHYYCIRRSPLSQSCTDTKSLLSHSLFLPTSRSLPTCGSRTCMRVQPTAYTSAHTAVFSRVLHR